MVIRAGFVAIFALTTALLAVVLESAAIAALPRFHVSERTEKPLIVCDRPYESFVISYFNVIREGTRWRLWYTAYDKTYRDDRDSYLCYAESADGVHWQKPSLGRVEFGGNRNNNILVTASSIGGLHGQTVFLDPAAPAAERYKMVYSSLVGSKWIVLSARSADGIAWQFDKRPLLSFNSDTQTVCLADEGVYRLYVRMWTGGDYKGLRSVGYSESPTFGSFKPPVEIFAADAADPRGMDFYNSAVTKLAPRRYVMFPSAFDHGKDVLLPHVAVSDDGRTFTRVGREPLLALGRGFDSMGIYIGPGAIAGPRPRTWWIYYLGTNVGHDQTHPQKVTCNGGFGRFLLSVEGL